MLHGSLTVTRDVNAAPARVWDAYANADLRARWRRLPGPDGVLQLDFRVGGWERLTGTSAATGTVEAIASHALFLDIVAGERIVACPRGAARRGAAVGVADLDRVRACPGDATRVTHTEQYTFLAWAGDGAHDQAHLRGSTQLAFNGLSALVEEPRD